MTTGKLGCRGGERRKRMGIRVLFINLSGAPSYGAKCKPEASKCKKQVEGEIPFGGRAGRQILTGIALTS